MGANQGWGGTHKKGYKLSNYQEEMVTEGGAHRYKLCRSMWLGFPINTAVVMTCCTMQAQHMVSSAHAHLGCSATIGAARPCCTAGRVGRRGRRGALLGLPGHRLAQRGGHHLHVGDRPPGLAQDEAACSMRGQARRQQSAVAWRRSLKL